MMLSMFPPNRMIVLQRSVVVQDVLRAQPPPFPIEIEICRRDLSSFSIQVIYAGVQPVFTLMVTESY